MNKVRRDFYTCRESDRRDAQPKQLSDEQQNYDADQRAYNRDRKMRRRILDGHVREAFVATSVYLISVLDTSTATPSPSGLGFDFLAICGKIREVRAHQRGGWQRTLLIRAVAQLGRAPGSGPGGRGFKSHQPDSLHYSPEQSPKTALRSCCTTRKRLKSPRFVTWTCFFRCRPESRRANKNKSTAHLRTAFCGFYTGVFLNASLRRYSPESIT